MRKIIILSALVLSNIILFSQENIFNQSPKKQIAFIDLQLKNSAEQYKYLASKLPADSFAKTFDKAHVHSNSKWWCSGFFPGTVLYLYEATKDEKLKAIALSKLSVLEKEQFNKTTHDLGFMMYCSFGNAQRLWPNDSYKNILVNSAMSLSTRFSSLTGSIRSWNNRKPNDFIVIIDNMMNLELLFYATKVSGDSSFYKIATTHADQTIRNHFRPDYSTYHVVDYNEKTGALQEKRTHQGAADSSAWARGQAWGLYGFTTTYRETKDKKYLDQANHIADFLINHPKLPADKIPLWDFDVPNSPVAFRDASAAAIMASAFIELAGYNEGKRKKALMDVAKKILYNLSSPEYRAFKMEKGGFLIKHGVGNMPAGTEVDVPLSYGDYYYVEAMMRYRRLVASQ